MSVGKRIKNRREELGLSVNEVAEKLKKDRATIYRYESDEIENMPLDVLEPLAKVLNISPAYLMGWEKGENLKGEYLIGEDGVKYNSNNIVALPVIGTIRAGRPILAAENIESYFPIDRSFIDSNKEYFFLRVKGDSMDLEFKEGNLLLIEKQSYVENGEIGVVLVNDEEATVKKIIRNQNMITLIPLSSNPDHIPQMIDTSKIRIQIIGKIKAVIKQY